MNDENRCEKLEASLIRLLSWISAADAKTSTVFAFSTVMLGVIAALLPSPSEWTICTGAWAVLSALLLFLSLLFSTFAAFPRTSGPKGSLVYFQGIACRDGDSYLAEIKKTSTSEYLEDLAKQCHRNAEIANAKFSWVRKAMFALYLGVIPWIVTVYKLYQQST